MKYDPRHPFTKQVDYDTNKRLAPRIAKTLDEAKDMLYHDNYARVTIGEVGKIKAQANRRGYRWSYRKEGGYYIITLKAS
jgi:hypothetical protein